MKRMSMKKFMAIVGEAIDSLPEAIMRHLENVVIDVEDTPSDEFLRKQGFTDQEIEEGETLYGLFMPLGVDTSDLDMLENPNRILIFKTPLEDDFPDPRELRIEIRKTVVHEIAHHFGWSDRDLERFDDNPNPFGE